MVRTLTQLNEPRETYHRDHLTSRYQGNNNNITSEEQSHGQIRIQSPCIGASHITEQYFSSLSHPSTSSHGVTSVDCSFINMLSHSNIHMLPSPSTHATNRVAVLVHSLPDKMHSTCLDESTDCSHSHLDDHARHFTATEMMQETSLVGMNNLTSLDVMSSNGLNSETHQLATIPEEQNCFTNLLPAVTRDYNGDHNVYLSGDNNTPVNTHDTTSSSYCESSATSTTSDRTTGGGVSCYLLDESSMVIIDSVFT